MKPVILESPFKGKIDYEKNPQGWKRELRLNIAYARACIRDALSRGEAPIASHILYTQPGILRDDIAEERQWGIDAGLAWKFPGVGSVVYTDRGISRGMEYGIASAKEHGRTVELRQLPGYSEEMLAAFMEPCDVQI